MQCAMEDLWLPFGSPWLIRGLWGSVCRLAQRALSSPYAILQPSYARVELFKRGEGPVQEMPRDHPRMSPSSTQLRLSQSNHRGRFRTQRCSVERARFHWLTSICNVFLEWVPTFRGTFDRLSALNPLHAWNSWVVQSQELPDS